MERIRRRRTRLPPARERAPAAAVEDEQGAGGKDFADHHPRHNKPHHPLRVLRQEDHQQGNHRDGADKLLQQLHNSGGPDDAGAVEAVFVAVLHSGEGHAGDQQNQPQLGAGIPQEIDGDGIGAQNHRRPHREQQEEKQLHAGGKGLVDGPAVAQGQVLGGQVRRR